VNTGSLPRFIQADRPILKEEDAGCFELLQGSCMSTNDGTLDPCPSALSTVIPVPVPCPAQVNGPRICQIQPRMPVQSDRSNRRDDWIRPRRRADSREIKRKGGSNRAAIGQQISGT
jgi:hypothetical protein